ncbi:DUF6233 domain-containing protein [Streptomyces griseoincarnatus]
MGRGPAGGVVHAPDCEEAPEEAPLLDVQQALDVAENPGTQLWLWQRELAPLVSGFRPHLSIVRA